MKTTSKTDIWDNSVPRLHVPEQEIDSTLSFLLEENTA